MPANEIMCGLWISLWNNCHKNVCKMNNILRRHYTNLVWSEVTKSVLTFTGPDSHTITTGNWEHIYKVLWVILQIDNCTNTNKCLTKLISCGLCDCQENDWYSLWIREAARSDLMIGDYTVDRDTIMINVGPNVNNGYVIYSRWPQKLTSMDSEICLDPMEMEIIQQEILRFHAEIRKDYEWATYFEQKWFNARNRLQNLIEDRIMSTAWFWISKK